MYANLLARIFVTRTSHFEEFIKKKRRKERNKKNL
jgi:hypothetical protein